jgi:signal transduction histidine kinase
LLKFFPLGEFDDLATLSWSLTGKLVAAVVLAMAIVTVSGYREIRSLSHLPLATLTLAGQRLLWLGALVTILLSGVIFVLVWRLLRSLENRNCARSEQQRQLINDLSHELRSPLSMVYSYLQRCQKQSQDLPPTQRESLDMAVADAERMKQLLEGWLNLARTDGQIVTDLNLNEILLEAAIMTEKLTNRTINVTLSQRIVKVRGDRSRLLQVFDHLLDNAVYYSREPVTVTVKVMRRMAIVDVNDRGCGIATEKLDRIFEPLYRVDSSRSRSTGGFGLGLPYVKRSIESFGGSIAVRSTVGVGSCFTVKLPLSGVR